MKKPTWALSAGDLNQILVFEHKSSTQDSTGAPVDTWTESFRIHGSFQSVTGVLGSREYMVALKRHEQTTAIFTVRYRTGIDSAVHRIQYRDKTWNIYAPVDPDGKRIQLKIEAYEVQ